MASTASVITGAIPVVGSVISGLINNADTDSNNAANRAFQEQQQQSQNAYNLQMWNMQNDYNAPAAQMQRLQDAGLNPNLVYGSGQATGNVAEAPLRSAPVEYVAQPKHAPDLGAASSQGIAAYNNLTIGAAQTNNLQAQTTNTLVDAVLKGVQAGLAAAQTGNTNADTGLKQAQTANTVTDTGLKQAETVNTGADTSLKNTQSSVTSMLAPYQAAMLAADVKKAQADTAFTISDNVRQASQTAMNLREGVARIGALAVQNAKSQAEINQINANTQLLMNSKWLTDMDISMRNNNMMPHDSAFQRVLGGIAGWITGQNSAGGFDPSEGSPFKKIPSKSIYSTPDYQPVQ